jgi:hypothetical protein
VALKKKYLHTTFFENTVSKLFIAAQTFRVSSIFDLYYTYTIKAWARWKGLLIKKYYKIRKKNYNFFYPNLFFFIFFQLGKMKMVEDYHLLLLSKPLEGDFCCLENY